MGEGHEIIHAATNGDITEVRRQLSLGVPLPAAMYTVCGRGEANVLATLLAAGGADEINARSEYGWTLLGQSADLGHVKCVSLLLAAGADPDRRVSNSTWHHTPLQLAIRPTVRPEHLRACYLLLRAGATIPSDAQHPYLLKVRAAGGFRAYEKAHRRRLAAILARVVFPRLPVDAVSHAVAFSFHTGAY